MFGIQNVNIVMCKWNNLYNLWHNSAWEFVLEITQNIS